MNIKPVQPRMFTAVLGKLGTGSPSRPDLTASPLLNQAGQLPEALCAPFFVLPHPSHPLRDGPVHAKLAHDGVQHGGTIGIWLSGISDKELDLGCLMGE